MREQVIAILPAKLNACRELGRMLLQVQNAGNKLAVVLMQLDHFYRVIEARGMDYGCEVMQLIEERLVAAGADRAAIWQMNDSTFLVAAVLGDNQADGYGVLERFKRTVQYPVGFGSDRFHLTASIGVSLFPQDGATSEQLICHAETALYSGILKGEGQISYYSPKATEQIHRHLELEAAIRTALYKGQFHLNYQPIYQVDNGKLRGFEVLLRWNHPQLGNVQPSEFIPFAEKNGMIVPIGAWVIKQACRMLSSLPDHAALVMSVNISPTELADLAYADMVLNTLEETEIPPHCLQLEIKEGYNYANCERSIKALTRLHASGVLIALDDFGSMHSSLANLQQLPIHALKLDRSFVREIDKEGVEHHIVEAMIGLLHKLGISVIAEGVEYVKQYELLRGWGCDYMQGYLLGQPAQPDMLDLSMIRKPERTGA
ncbi:diguanylate cyclase (GGDEF) domain-containing protein [Paenibacillus algorifonticola]|uniref:Diguanylate cyclase (GGDEF) domain-containing protein n=1 Tax=Paenibacillus algorifonticola TaxID=684063 RepID=A0A1I2H9E2_9BACL|nr:bifunctional diguanylate cyclase/phosphodiesterase [Paenibacillus algorifonticola]SFF26845.1 diguanylate cyclase (GGDEF) domain-containing protein [Paenibacillus algorifonticola]